ncbi:MAG: hypothetical protein E7645_00410 [Ruminococcaceae bacterium]|nr:hypothetical protein [Oscillospiraceae bacterium]
MKKNKKNSEYRNSKSAMADTILNSLPATLIVALLCFLMGVFFIIPQQDNKPIPREEAVAYEGKFEKYTTARNDCTIHFTDGSTYEIYPHTESSDLRKAMNSLEKGTRLYLMVNPNNGYVVEIKTDTQELMNFETSQEELDAFDNGYIFIGVFVIFCGVFFIVYAVIQSTHKRKEADRLKKRDKRRTHGVDDTGLRRANMGIKCKILLEKTVGYYRICYRRVGSTNELIVNGVVYDEMKSVIEFEHDLCATVDGHEIHVGYDDDSHSYIIFDGKRVAEKLRLI